MCKMTLSYAEHTAYMCNMTHSFIFVKGLNFMRSILHLCVRDDAFIRVTRRIHVCSMTHSNVRHESFVCETWLIHIRDMTHSCVQHDPFIRGTYRIRITHSYVWHDSSACVTWLIHICDMTHSNVWLDSHIWEIWLIHICEVNHSYMWREPFMGVTWTIHGRDVFISCARHDVSCKIRSISQKRPTHHGNSICGRHEKTLERFLLPCRNRALSPISKGIFCGRDLHRGHPLHIRTPRRVGTLHSEVISAQEPCKNRALLQNRSTHRGHCIFGRPGGRHFCEKDLGLYDAVSLWSLSPYTNRALWRKRPTHRGHCNVVTPRSRHPKFFLQVLPYQNGAVLRKRPRYSGCGLCCQRNLGCRLF